VGWQGRPVSNRDAAGNVVAAVRGSSPSLAVTVRESVCLNSDLPARTATRRCLRTLSRRASARTNVRSAPRASIPSWRMSVRTAGAASFPDQSGPRETGKATTSLGRILRVPRLGTGPLILDPMRGSQPQSRQSRLTNAEART
jgi:hypothetical protein